MAHGHIRGVGHSLECIWNEFGHVHRHAILGGLKHVRVLFASAAKCTHQSHIIRALSDTTAVIKQILLPGLELAAKIMRQHAEECASREDEPERTPHVGPRSPVFLAQAFLERQRSHLLLRIHRTLAADVAYRRIASIKPKLFRIRRLHVWSRRKQEDKKARN